MNNHQIQNLLSASGAYKGKIDGIIGKQSRAAARKILEDKFEATDSVWFWSDDRQLIAAAQAVLQDKGFYGAKIDGYAGHLTNEGYALWSGELKAPDRDSEKPEVVVKSSFPHQSQCSKFYGVPQSKELINQLAMYTLPLPMRIDYDLTKTSTRVELHSKCGPSAISAVENIVRHYGEKRWRELGLDRNAGTYNPRKMRGGTSWSMHAYGCAWDFYAGPNGLMTRCPDALFCGDEYRAFFNIWESFGWTSLGRAIGRDWMHVQAATL